jgi:hypothetical protein
MYVCSRKINWWSLITSKKEWECSINLYLFLFLLLLRGSKHSIVQNLTGYIRPKNSPYYPVQVHWKKRWWMNIQKQSFRKTLRLSDNLILNNPVWICLWKWASNFSHTSSNLWREWLNRKNKNKLNTNLLLNLQLIATRSVKIHITVVNILTAGSRYAKILV